MSSRHLRSAPGTASLTSRLYAALAVALALASCKRAPPADDPSLDPSLTVDLADAGPHDCVIFLHGKSGSGEPSVRNAAFWLLRPRGNAEGWGGRQWLYFPEQRYQELRRNLARTLTANACTRALLHGFSNGGAAVAKLYCRGEDFGGKVRGYIMDDPVPDHGVEPCAPPTGAKARLYWTTALNHPEGWRCAEQDWTCEGGSTLAIEAYAARLGLQPTSRDTTRHEPYTEPPEYRSWW